MEDESTKMLTLSLPPERSEEKELFAQAKMIAEQALIQKLLNAVHDLVVIFNQEREIVYANPAFFAWLQLEQAEQVCGLRLGEAVQCVNAHQLKEGCGSSEKCEGCGALRAILRAQKGDNDARLYELLDKHGNSSKLHITTTPIQVDGQQFILFSAVPVETKTNLNKLQPIVAQAVREMRDLSKQLWMVSGEQAKPLLERLNTLIELLSNLVGG